MTFEPLYSLSGLVVGALVGITGVGGGSLMTPLLVLLFGVHPATAVGTDLLYAAITKTAGTAVHGMHGRVNWKIVGSLAAGSVPAALLMLWLMAGVDRKSIGVTNTITTALGWLLVMTAIMLVSAARSSNSPAAPSVIACRRSLRPSRSSRSFSVLCSACSSR